MTPRARLRSSADSMGLGTGLVIALTRVTTAKLPRTCQPGHLPLGARRFENGGRLDTLEVTGFRLFFHLITLAVLRPEAPSARRFSLAGYRRCDWPMADRNRERPDRRGASPHDYPTSSSRSSQT